MPWAFSTSTSFTCNLLIFLGVVWGIGSTFFNAARFFIKKHSFQMNILFMIFTFLGFCSLVSDFSYIRETRKFFNLEHSVRSTFYHFTEETKHKNANNDLGYYFPPNEVLNSRVNGYRINVGLFLTTLASVIFIFLRQLQQKKLNNDTMKSDLFLAAAGIGGFCITFIYIILWKFF